MRRPACVVRAAALVCAAFVSGAMRGQSGNIAVTSVTPSSGVGATQTFGVIVSDANGGTDIATVWIYIISSFTQTSAANSCLAYYDRASNNLHLINDAGTAWYDAQLGSAVLLSNSQCSLSAAGSGISFSGATATYDFGLTLLPAFAGLKGIYAYASSAGGAVTDWQTMGSWTVPSGVAVKGVSPPAGSGASQDLELILSSSLGGSAIATAWIYVSATMNLQSAANSCMAYYSSATNGLYLLNNAGTAWSDAPLGSNTPLANSQCSLSPRNSTVTSAGTEMRVKFALSFTAAFAGHKIVGAWAGDSPLNSGWQRVGSWDAGPLTVKSITPTSGLGFGQKFVEKISSATGASAIDTIWFWVVAAGNADASNRGCVGYFAPGSSSFFLFDDLTQQWRSASTGSQQTLTSGPCSLDVGASSVEAEGSDTLVVSFALSFSASFAGPKSVKGFASTAGNLTNTGWQTMAFWNVADFSIAVGPWSAQAAPGGTAATYTVTVDALSGFSDGVTLSATGLPAGVTASFGSTSVNAGGSTTITLTAGTGVPTGSYVFTVKGASGGREHAATATLNVTNGGSYAFYVNDGLTSIEPARWMRNGTVEATAAGLAAPDPAGGSLISAVGAPDGSSDYEVRMRVRLADSGGVYTLFARATPDARTGTQAAGTYYAYEMTNPTFSADRSSCWATFILTKRANGVVTSFAAYPAACHDGMLLRLLVREGPGGTALRIWHDEGAMGYDYVDGGIPTGRPGVGACGMPGSNAISSAWVGPADRVGPHPLDPGSVAVAAFPNRVEFQTQGVTDNDGGIGVASYNFLRDGQWAGSSPVPEYVDESVGPGQTHVYTIYASDQHGNSASPATLTVQTPPANSVEPRRVGLRPTGAYWGAAGEQVDLYSGNLNFSVQLLRAQGRGGWNAPLALSYNSQIWRRDAGGVWRLGRDTGYGLGWRLQAGSVAPVWSDCWTLHHWVFADASGAEYRLDRNIGNNLWISADSTYVAFDSANHMVMLCDSYGNPQGQLVFWYPTPDVGLAPQPTQIITTMIGQPATAAFDEHDQLIIQDHTWNRYLFYAWSNTAPVVSITNQILALAADASSVFLGGTGSALAGTMIWRTSAGASGTFAAKPVWLATVPLTTNVTLITVIGTNSAGVVGSDTTTITRQVLSPPAIVPLGGTFTNSVTVTLATFTTNTSL
ncbi:MAG: hypothetical protein LAQ30_02025, partial [Acidobacteriia bacterium]|nr:hypothetical protein [Terriglobia bacterium]